MAWVCAGLVGLSMPVLASAVCACMQSLVQAWLGVKARQALHSDTRPHLKLIMSRSTHTSACAASAVKKK
ncbi:hypothetical protein PVAP13_8KG371302, partial [Panicum virgatum]